MTDCLYRSAIPAIYSLKRLGEEIVAVTTDKHPNPPAFHSRHINERVVLPSNEAEYKDALISLCKKYSMPVILPIGVFTLNIIASNIDEFKKVAYFAVSEKSILDRLNDKKEAKALAVESGLDVPRITSSFPAVVKPFCGEKFGLKASERYKIVTNENELKSAIEHFSAYDGDPIVEEYIDGDGVGVSVVIGCDGIERSAFCHRRLSEYPSSGGPSSSLVTFKDDAIIEQSVKMLRLAGFVGIAMLEYKLYNGKYFFLEVNPRIWGSFGATYKADSDFLKGYLAGAKGEVYPFSPIYKQKKIKFLPNILASSLSYMKSGKIKMGFKVLCDGLNPFVPNAIFSITDPLPAIFDLFRKRR